MLDVHAQTESFPLPGVGPLGEDLTIDVAWLGAREPSQAVVVSSGLHGVEGFFGSAVQLAWLRRLADGDLVVPPRTTVVLVHALNPFGFAWRRRADANNVDLNRNCVEASAGEAYGGAPDGFERVRRFLAPRSAPSWLAPAAFRVGAAWQVFLHGRPFLQSAVAGGQYEDPDGLFYGGTEPSPSAAIVQDQFWEWTRGARAIVHLDLHTGLGDYADYQLFIEAPHAEHLQWYWTHFDYERVVSVADNGIYTARGVMGAWLARHADDRRYRFACVEVGTHPMLRVLAALRAENRVHHHASPDMAIYARVKREVVECFCPRSPLWRHKATQRALDVIDHAVAASGRVK